MTKSYIEIRDVSYCYPGSSELALQAIQLDIPSGEIFGVLGQNGAGKSTLLSILSGILPLQSGAIQIDGKKLPDDVRRIRAISAIVPQDYAFYATLTVQENLEFFAGLLFPEAAKRRERITFGLQTCQLDEVKCKRAGACSGGYKRRLNLAIALLGEPSILYLDEPTVGIDPQSRRFILNAIKELREQGMTIIYTSHYFEEVEALCDKVAIIDGGKVIYQEDCRQRASQGGTDLETRFLQLTAASRRLQEGAA